MVTSFSSSSRKFHGLCHILFSHLLTLSPSFAWIPVKSLSVFCFLLTSPSSELPSSLSENKHLIMLLIFNGTLSSLAWHAKYLRFLTHARHVCASPPLHIPSPGTFFIYFLYWQSAASSTANSPGHLWALQIGLLLPLFWFYLPLGSPLL